MDDGRVTSSVECPEMLALKILRIGLAVLLLASGGWTVIPRAQKNASGAHCCGQAGSCSCAAKNRHRVAANLAAQRGPVAPSSCTIGRAPCSRAAAASVPPAPPHYVPVRVTEMSEPEEQKLP